MTKRERLEHVAMLKRSIVDENNGMNYNSMFYWWPKVKNLDVPMPRTEVVFHGIEAYEDFFEMFDGRMNGVAQRFDRVFEVTKKFPDGPIFIRGDQTSGKHHWERTCCVQDRSRTSVFMHLKELAEDHESKFWLGPPLLGYAVREMLPTECYFKAFHGHMPVTREWRYFYLDGEVVCRHPYWPMDAIEQGTDPNYLRGDWREILEKINTEDERDVQRLTDMAIKIGRAVEDEVARGWSIDFLQAKDGQYYFIDCAMAEMSYHWDGCEKAEIFKIKEWRDKDDANGEVQTP